MADLRPIKFSVLTGRGIVYGGTGGELISRYVGNSAEAAKFKVAVSRVL
jgi:hypothetical protein